jgi:hypothetical protein
VDLVRTAHHPAIITRAMFDAAQTIAAEHRTRRRRPQRQPAAAGPPHLRAAVAAILTDIGHHPTTTGNPQRPATTAPFTCSTTTYLLVIRPDHGKA